MTLIAGPSSTMIGNTFRGDYNILRFLNKRLVSSVIEIALELEFDDNAKKQDQVDALSRMKRWLDNVLEGSVAFNTKSEIPTASLEWVDNHLMFCPDEPYDFILMLLIYAKLNAIGQGAVEVTHFQIHSDQGEGFGNWFDGDPNTILPSHKEWSGEVAYFDKQWWNRPDGSMIDMWVGPEDSVDEKPDILIDLTEDDDLFIDEQAEAAEIIKPNFQPTIIRND